MKAITTENRQLKEELAAVQASLQELMEGESPQLSRGAYPNSRLTPEEQLQLTRMQQMGVMGVAAPAGTQEEQIRQIRAAKSPEALTEYLRSQGSVVGQNYEGQGFAY